MGKDFILKNLSNWYKVGQGETQKKRYTNFDTPDASADEGPPKLLDMLSEFDHGAKCPHKSFDCDHGNRRCTKFGEHEQAHNKDTCINHLRVLAEVALQVIMHNHKDTSWHVMAESVLSDMDYWDGNASFPGGPVETEKVKQ